MDLGKPQVAQACGCVGGHIALDLDLDLDLDLGGPQVARGCGCIGGHIVLDLDLDLNSGGPQVAVSWVCDCIGGHIDSDLDSDSDLDLDSDGPNGVSGCSSLDSEGNIPGSVAGSCIPASLLQEEEEESGESKSDVSPQDKNLTEELDELTVSSNSEGDGTAEPGPARALLEDLRCRLALQTLDAPQTALDYALDVLCNFSMLCTACEKLAVVSKDKKIDILFRARVASMVGTLNLFLDPELKYT